LTENHEEYDFWGRKKGLLLIKLSRIKTPNLILEHSNLSLSNNRFVHEGFPFSSTTSALRWDIVDSNAYRDVNANLFPSTCSRYQTNLNVAGLSLQENRTIKCLF
jgi:hypothetical protein